MSIPITVLADLGLECMGPSIARPLEGIATGERGVALRWIDLYERRTDLTAGQLVAPVALIGTSVATGAPSDALVRYLRNLDPMLGIYVCVASRAERDGRVADFLQAGADDVLVLAASGDGAFLRSAVVSRLLLISAVGPCVRRFAEVYPRSAALAEATFVVRNPHVRLTTDELARRFGMHKATLYKRFRRVGLPAPALLTRWARLKAATELREQGLAQDDIARRLGWSDSRALRKARGRLRKRTTSIAVARVPVCEGGLEP